MSDERSLAVNDLRRSVPFHLTRDDDNNGDGFTLDGYAAVFDTPTRIDSWEGTFDETIAKGAFRKSIRENTPKLQFDHGYHPLIGSIPIGRISSLAEDDQGLHVVARLSDNWLVEPVRDAIAEGSVDGMSFRFSVVREEWRDKDGKTLQPSAVLELLWEPGDRGPLTRTLKEVRVAELGPVVWPAYSDTSVAVRSKIIDLARLVDPAQRSTLARAVFLADMAERDTEVSGPTETTDAPPATGGHPSEEPVVTNDTPQTTDTPSAGEHVTAQPRGMRPIDLWVRKARDTVLTFDR